MSTATKDTPIENADRRAAKVAAGRTEDPRNQRATVEDPKDSETDREPSRRTTRAEVEALEEKLAAMAADLIESEESLGKCRRMLTMALGDSYKVEDIAEVILEEKDREER